MTEANVDWQSYESTPPKPSELANANMQGLDDQTEYVWALQRVSLKRDVPKNVRSPNGETCDVFYTVWQEEKTKNLIMIRFRVDHLGNGWKRAKNPKFERGIVQFFDRIGTPIDEGKVPSFGSLFIMGMRFRGRVDIGLTDGIPNGYYHLNMPTIRRFSSNLVSDTISPR
jgi:hypothetical protein